MPITSEEMRLRDVAIGLQAELTEAIYQREKYELANAELRNEIQDLNDRLRLRENEIQDLNDRLRLRENEIQDLNDRLRLAEVAHEALENASRQATEKLHRIIAMRDAEITAIHQSHTWRIGFFVMAPLRWIKRSKR